jgi:hypothetical protein
LYRYSLENSFACENVDYEADYEADYGDEDGGRLSGGGGVGGGDRDGVGRGGSGGRGHDLGGVPPGCTSVHSLQFTVHSCVLYTHQLGFELNLTCIKWKNVKTQFQAFAFKWVNNLCLYEPAKTAG